MTEQYVLNKEEYEQLVYIRNLVEYAKTETNNLEWFSGSSYHINEVKRHLTNIANIVDSITDNGDK